jgi:spore coat polysaccharide biosynthesis protein SpsF
VVEGQIALLRRGFDYVGSSGWPLGIAGEVATAKALGEAAREARDPAEREHVMPFLYARPERFRIGTLAAPSELAHHRYTVDTEDDLAFARAIAARLGHGPPVHLGELDALIRAEPSLASMNAAVVQKEWQQVDHRAEGMP